MARLKNGVEANQVMVDKIVQGLHSLQKKEPIAFVELIHTCRNPEYRVMSEGIVLTLSKGYSLTNANFFTRQLTPHQLVRELVELCVTGEGLNLSIESPWPAELSEEQGEC